MTEVLIKLTPADHRLLLAFLRVGIEAVKAEVEDVRNDGLDPNDGERIMGEVS